MRKNFDWRERREKMREDRKVREKNERKENQWERIVKLYH